jgi:uncharacterized damage-inducible protein DinB
MTEDPRYPIGKHQKPAHVSAVQREEFIRDIDALPRNLQSAVQGLDAAQLDTPYREGGWTVRQVVHHLADSHMNAYTRFKLALTEQEPVIKPYNEKDWAELRDSKSSPIELSLAILEGLHTRWVTSIRAQAEEKFSRKFRHPERGIMNIDDLLALYAWHSRHHVAHIVRLRERMGW